MQALYMHGHVVFNTIFRCDSISRNTLYTGHSLTYSLTHLLSHRVDVIFLVRFPGLSDSPKMSRKVI